ncbi:cysteine dioxygenase [Castellaniella sp. FW104-16D08]|uniref:cysteine dioxygenase family protein n=1 Tax=unclassified Castellaniella TaxID=2617606 RepID=UPI0033157478
MATERLLDAVQKLTQLAQQTGPDETLVLQQAGGVIRDLVAHDDWLPPEMAQSDPIHYRQYLLYGDPLDRFSLVSFVWGPGQHTPIHNHTVWGVIGMLRGEELSQPFGTDAQGRFVAQGEESVLHPGEITCVSPTLGDVHRVSNAHQDQVSISIHLYGGNIGRIRRSVYDPATGAQKSFVSGYSNAQVPNLWQA